MILWYVVSEGNGDNKSSDGRHFAAWGVIKASIAHFKIGFCRFNLLIPFILVSIFDSYSHPYR